MSRLTNLSSQATPKLFLSQNIINNVGILVKEKYCQIMVKVEYIKKPQNFASHKVLFNKFIFNIILWCPLLSSCYNCYRCLYLHVKKAFVLSPMGAELVLMIT